jgi:hypothetical protein
VSLDKPGIVGARWWHQGLLDEERKVSRRQMLIGLGVAGGAVAAVAGLGVGVATLFKPEKTSLARRNSMAMQKQYGWDFGARGVPLVFNGQAEGPFVRGELQKMAAVMTPARVGHVSYYVPTLVSSLTAMPTTTLPDPEDGRPRPDGAPFRRLADVILPIVTPEMREAYAAGEAFARIAAGRPGTAALADLPGPQAVAFAAGAAAVLDPVLLLDNWPHPQGVVPSHLTLAALAYYQPRFASLRAQRAATALPLFVLDRQRLNAYSEQSDRFDNRYYARMPRLDSLGRLGVRTLFYVVASPSALPEPDDLNAVLSAGGGDPVSVVALALTDFWNDRPDPAAARVYYGGTPKGEGTFWSAQSSGRLTVDDFTPGAAKARASTADHVFTSRRAAASATPPATLGMVPVIVTDSGLILSAALDRSGSMNRFAGGWSG